MKLDVYRSCSRPEKRDVLGAYWHRGVESGVKVNEAALQYGPWAILCLVVLALELVPVIVLSFGHVDVLGWIAVALEAAMLVSLWWAVVRFTELRGAVHGAAVG